MIVSAWVLRAGWGEVQRLSGLECRELARAAGRSVLHLAAVLAGVLLVLGLVDYGLRYSRFEAMLRTTPQEQREDQRTMEGDVAVPGTTATDCPRLARRLAGPVRRCQPRADRSRRPDAGPVGRALRRDAVTIRTAASGEAGHRLRRSAETARIPQVEAGALARRLARHTASGPPISAEQIAELAAIWPPRSAS